MRHLAANLMMIMVHVIVHADSALQSLLQLVPFTQRRVDEARSLSCAAGMQVYSWFQQWHGHVLSELKLELKAVAQLPMAISHRLLSSQSGVDSATSKFCSGQILRLLRWQVCCATTRRHCTSRGSVETSACCSPLRKRRPATAMTL